MNNKLSRRQALTGLAGCLFAGALGAAEARTYPELTEKPILTVTGKIAGANKDIVQFDRGALENLGMVSFATTTPWYRETVTFEGVPLAKLLDVLDAHGETLIAVALNDYSTEIPLADAAKYGPILALKRNGEYMPVRDKGPLFIVYNYDSNAELKTQKFYNRSAWQVTRIEVK